MSNYTLTELLDLAKFRVDWINEFTPGSFRTWDQMPEAQKIAHAAATDKLLDEIEARKKNLNPLGFPKPVDWRIPSISYNVTNLRDQIKRETERHALIWEPAIEVGVQAKPENTEGPWTKWDEVPEGIEYWVGSQRDYWYVNRTEDGKPVRMYVDPFGEAKSISWAVDDNKLGIYTRRNPRTWDSLEDAPEFTAVKDCDGDFWRHNGYGDRQYKDRQGTEWADWESEKIGDLYSPYTEVLNG